MCSSGIRPLLLTAPCCGGTVPVMLLGLLVAAAALAAPDGGPVPTAIVVATQANDALVERMARVKTWNSAVDAQVIDATEAQRRMTGIMSPRLVDTAATRKAFDESIEEDGRFEAAKAEALRREVVRDFDNAVVPSVELAELAAKALHGSAAAYLHDGKPREAKEAASEALRRFPQVPLDTHQHPPDVAKLLKSVQRELAGTPSTEISIALSKPGRVFANGQDLGETADTLKVKLQQGRYLLWAADGEGSSLAHFVVVASTPQTVTIDFALESKLQWTPVPTLRCAASCEADLRKLATAVGVDQAVGLELVENAEVARGLYVPASAGQPEERVIAALAEPKQLLLTNAYAPESKPFSPLLLVPFGVGQISQKRYVAGGVYAAIQTGLLAWHVSTVIRHHGDEDTARERDLRSQRNLSAGLLIGAVVANVVEALVVHAIE